VVCLSSVFICCINQLTDFECADMVAAEERKIAARKSAVKKQETADAKKTSSEKSA
jgi:hypothetical protein